MRIDYFHFLIHALGISHINSSLWYCFFAFISFLFLTSSMLTGYFISVNFFRDVTCLLLPKHMIIHFFAIHDSGILLLATSCAGWCVCVCGGVPCGVVTNMLKCDTVVNEFELQPHSYIHFLTNTMKPHIPASYGLNSTTTVLLHGLLWH